jgi:hypothetical protein
MEPTATLARRFWAAIEPLHAVVYFAPEPLEAARKTGLRGFWMSYFASRVAPLGPLPAPAVEAMTYGFAPAMVARAIPDAWKFAAPEAVLEARLASAPAALREHAGAALLGPAAELADLLWEGAAGCRFDGRPLAAAWAGVPRPADPVGALWLAATVLREHRGDGHFAALAAADIDGCEAVALRCCLELRREDLQPVRGWTDEAWDDALARLAARGWVGADGELTSAGRAAHAAVEDATDWAAARPWARLDPDTTAGIVTALAPLAQACARVLPYPSPIGVPAPGAALHRGAS